MAILLGDKKGRKFLVYVIGIAIVIALLPVIAVFGLFGGMSGDISEFISYEQIKNTLPAEQRELMEQHKNELDRIETVFEVNGLSDTDISKAKTIYISCLVGKETEEDFYERYADCFLLQSEENDLLDNISSAFGIYFTDEERQQFNNLYS
ncbi:MAG: hypothetical protein IJZ83_10200 [Clostridia bacterium]|nr:hypothetical protein [Clostridia bacterium]